MQERGFRIQGSSAMNYSDLAVWQKAMNMVTETYKVTAIFPSEGRYGLSSQIRRAAVSVPSNIAEGAWMQSNGGIY